MELKKGFKLTELGYIPVDWKIENLGDRLTGTPKYGINAAAVAFDSRYPTYLRITDITDDGKINRDSLASVNHPLADNYKLENHDVVFARTGASVGKSYLYQEKDGNFVYAGFLIRVRTEKNKLYAPYLFYFSKSGPYWKWIRENSMRSGQPGVNGKQYSELILPLPPTIKEQEAIANALSDADAYIESLEKLIAKKRLIKKGVMQELITGKRRINSNGKFQKFQSTPLGKLPTDWKVLELPKIIWFQEGPGLRNWQFKKNGLKVINVTNLQHDGNLDLSLTDRHVDWLEFEKIYKHFLIDEGDFVMASSGNSYCKTSIVRKQDLPLLMNTSVIRFKPLEGLDSKYMEIYLASNFFKDQIDQMITGGAQPNFGPAHLRKAFIPIPPTMSEQIEIAKILTDLEMDISSQVNQLLKARLLKQGIMQELLTGRIRLV